MTIALMSELHKPQVAILASGEGTTAEAFILATVARRANLEVPLVVSNNRYPGAFSRVTALNRIHKLDIEKLYIGPTNYPRRFGEVAMRGTTLWQSEAMCEAITKRGIDHVALMGFMQIVTGDLLREYGYLPEYESIYQARMSNTHRGPLPLTADAYGPEIEKRVLASGRKTSEHTVHLVSAGVDRGPVIARHRFKIEPGWAKTDLYKKGQAVEKHFLPLDIDRFLELQAGYEVSQAHGSSPIVTTQKG
jgi:folate-dependent phosphoribosylglycinamide formyltransferase PurN